MKPSQITKTHKNSVEPSQVWLNLLRWALIVSNVPVGIYIGTICGNVLNYIGQSPNGLFALVNTSAMENQLLILRFLPYWAKHRVIGTLIILQVPISALGGRWAVRSIQRENKQLLLRDERERIDRELDSRYSTLRQQILQEVWEIVIPIIVLQLSHNDPITSHVHDKYDIEGYNVEAIELKTTVYPMDDGLSVEKEDQP